MAEHRSIAMRCNRLLGASLVEHNLIRLEHLEAANERMLELMAGGGGKQVSLLSILLHEIKAIEEEKLLTHQLEEHGLGLIELRDLEWPDDFKEGLDLDACWSTWTVPFDREDEVHYLASAYYLSPPVRQFWEQRLRGIVVWYGTYMASIHEFLEHLGQERMKLAAPAAAKN